MKKFVIVTDSCSEMNRELRERFDVDYIPMSMTVQGKVMDADLDWQEVSVKEFYENMRNGGRVTTAQITAAKYKERFEQYIKDGCDVLSITCSSALSASIHSSIAARDELLKVYPDSKIICIDSLMAGFGLGMMCIHASEMRAEGKTIEETAAWVEANKLKVHQECTVDKLTYLKQAGRVSAASAFFGGLLNVKPIIISDAVGNNAAVEKVKGRQTSIDRVVERFKEQYEDVPYQRIFVGHADCEEEGLKFKENIMEAMPNKNVEVYFGNIGPIIGGSAGPGTLAVYFYGTEVTYAATEK